VTSLSKTTQEVVETRTSSSLLSELLLFQNKSQSATWELRFLYIFQILSAATHANNFVTGKTPTEEGRHRPSVVKLVTKATIALTRPSVQTALATTLPLASTALNGSLKRVQQVQRKHFVHRGPEDRQWLWPGSDPNWDSALQPWPCPWFRP